jgi:MFS family permease
VNRDVRFLLAAQGIRALAYGFGAVLLGLSLEASGWSELQVGALLAAVVAGTALMSLLMARYAERAGRRRWYAALFIGLAIAGAVFAATSNFALLFAIALTGTLSTDVIESGPFTSLEQAMLPSGLDARSTTRVFGLYNAVAALLGSAGALAAGGPTLLRDAWSGAPSDQRFFLAFTAVGLAGAVLALGLSHQVEAERRPARSAAPLQESRATVYRLGALFAVDSFAGGFIVQSFIAYWLRREFDISPAALGVLFFTLGLVQTASFLAAPRLAERFGLLQTMVFSHLPSNVLLLSIAFAPSLPLAIGLLIGRQALSQMDVPTRQAYLALLVRPEERTAAAAYTNTARYATRPIAPLLAGVSQQTFLGLPFVIGGGLKIAYDIVLWLWFRRIAPEDVTRSPGSLPDGR